MSTHCTINFCDESGQACAKVYRHSDGYPDGNGGVLADLALFFEDVKSQTSGDARFNDPSYLAAKYVVWQSSKYRRSSAALDFLGVGVLMQDPGDIAYAYNLICGSRSLPPAVRVVSARGAEPCEACGGCGALFNISTIHYLVERCDVCKKFASDHEAGEVVRAASGRGGLAVVVVEAAFEKKGS
jgi:hypothetical protein